MFGTIWRFFWILEITWCICLSHDGFAMMDLHKPHFKQKEHVLWNPFATWWWIYTKSWCIDDDGLRNTWWKCLTPAWCFYTKSWCFCKDVSTQKRDASTYNLTAAVNISSAKSQTKGFAVFMPWKVKKLQSVFNWHMCRNYHQRVKVILLLKQSSYF